MLQAAGKHWTSGKQQLKKERPPDQTPTKRADKMNKGDDTCHICEQIILELGSENDGQDAVFCKGTLSMLAPQNMCWYNLTGFQ